MGSDPSQGSPAWMTTYSDMVICCCTLHPPYSFSVDLHKSRMLCRLYILFGAYRILRGSTDMGMKQREADISDYMSRDFNLNLSEDLALWR